MNKFTIPSDRKNVKEKSFKKALEERKATTEQNYHEKYCELKYQIVVFASKQGVLIAVLIWLISSIFGHLEIRNAAQFYLQTIATLYIGALISKEF